MKTSTTAAKNTIVGLGELLWDVFPDRKELGERRRILRT